MSRGCWIIKGLPYCLMGVGLSRVHHIVLWVSDYQDPMYCENIIHCASPCPIQNTYIRTCTYTGILPVVATNTTNQIMLSVMMQCSNEMKCDASAHVGFVPRGSLHRDHTNWREHTNKCSILCSAQFLCNFYCVFALCRSCFPA